MDIDPSSVDLQAPMKSFMLMILFYFLCFDLSRTASAGLRYLLIVLYLKCFKLQILMKAGLQSSWHALQYLNLSGACGVKIQFCKLGPK